MIDWNGNVTNYTYDLARNTIMTATIDPNSAAAGVSNPFDPVRLLQLTQGSDQHARLLSQRILDGVTVDVVQVARTPSTSTAAQEIVTFYIDAHSYILRRVVITTGPTGSAPSFTLRFVAYGTVPLSRVPPHTFTLNAPTTARVVVPVNHVQQLSVAQAVALPA